MADKFGSQFCASTSACLRWIYCEGRKVQAGALVGAAWELPGRASGNMFLQPPTSHSLSLPFSPAMCSNNLHAGETAPHNSFCLRVSLTLD